MTREKKVFNAASRPVLPQEEADRLGRLLVEASFGFDGDEKALALIKQGANLNILDEDTGDAPLHWSIMLDRKELFSALVAAGADVNLRRDNAFTPLILAVIYGHADMVTALLDAGADPHGVDDDGDTALSYAGKNKELADILVTAGEKNRQKKDWLTAGCPATEEKQSAPIPDFKKIPFPGHGGLQ